MKIHDLPLHRRPREKLLEKGSGALSDAELLAILIRTGYLGKSALDVAERILGHMSLSELVNKPLRTLKTIKGVGPAHASILVAVAEIARRLQPSNQITTVTTPDEVVRVVHFLRSKKQEHLVCLYLNARNQLLVQEVIGIGTLNSTLFHPREVFAPALKHRCAAVILVHNHPSGDVTPSEDDIVATEKLVEAGEILDIPVLDHIIIGPKSWTSLKKERLL